MSDLCPECIERLRSIAAARMGSGKREKKGAEDDYIGRKVELEPEVSSVFDQIRQKLQVIQTYGGKEGKAALPPLVDGYNTAIGHLEGRDYVLALENAQMILGGVDSEYGKAIGRMGVELQAGELLNEAKRDLSSIEKDYVSAPVAQSEKDARGTQMKSAVSEAEERIKAKDYEGAVAALKRMGYAASAAREQERKDRLS
jgi:hypothetical protein